MFQTALPCLVNSRGIPPGTFGGRARSAGFPLDGGPFASVAGTGVVVTAGGRFDFLALVLLGARLPGLPLASLIAFDWRLRGIMESLPISRITIIE